MEMYFASRMRIEGCTTKWARCNKIITCRNCHTIQRINELEERLKTLELQFADQSQMVNNLVYKTNNPYMEWPF